MRFFSFCFTVFTVIGFMPAYSNDVILLDAENKDGRSIDSWYWDMDNVFPDDLDKNLICSLYLPSLLDEDKARKMHKNQIIKMRESVDNKEAVDKFLESLEDATYSAKCVSKSSEKFESLILDEENFNKNIGKD